MLRLSVMPRGPGYTPQLPPKYICPCIPKRPSNANFFSNARHCLAHLAMVCVCLKLLCME